MVNLSLFSILMTVMSKSLRDEFQQPTARGETGHKMFEKMHEGQDSNEIRRKKIVAQRSPGVLWYVS